MNIFFETAGWFSPMECQSCDWSGIIEECNTIGDIGPLCPNCNNIAEHKIKETESNDPITAS